MLWITWMTSSDDRLEHAVTDDTGVRGAKGRYRAVCGHLVSPRALVSPPGPACPRCQTHLDQRHHAPPWHRAGRRPITLFAAPRDAE
ncbi:MAG: hypothetical protein ACRDRH_09960 [Pseudonocardia sp.]